MRPSSNSFISNFVPTYESELQDREKSWKSELTDLVSKVKGSSLKDHDKERIVKELIIELTKAL